MDKATQALAGYVNEKGFSVSAISTATKIPYGKIWSSLTTGGTRTLRADEFLSICQFVGKHPFDFHKTK